MLQIFYNIQLVWENYKKNSCSKSKLNFDYIFISNGFLALIFPSRIELRTRYYCTLLTISIKTNAWYRASIAQPLSANFCSNYNSLNKDNLCMIVAMAITT